MRSRQLGADGQRIYALVFDIGDEVIEGLTSFARDEGLDAAHFTAIGALRDVTLGYWDWNAKDYERISLREQVEVLTLAGNVARAPDGGAKVHAHIVVGRRDGTAHGGHLLEGHVRPTLEVVLTETPARLQRRTDPATGLALIDLDQAPATRSGE